MVQIDQGEPAHTAARQAFDRPGTDAADANHHHMGIKNPVCPGHAIQAAQATEAALKLGCHSRSSSQI
jgi:hypothetical protein